MRPKRAPRRAASPSTTGAEHQRLFRNLAIGLAIALVISLWLVISAAPPKVTEADRVALHHYEQMRVALAHDDLAGARDVATIMMRDSPGKNPFRSSAVVIQQTDSLNEARSAFARMSEHAQRLVKGNRGFFIVGCAMDRCPVKCSPCRMSDYADWVQTTEDIENPFMGRSSPHCGVIKISY